MRERPQDDRHRPAGPRGTERPRAGGFTLVEVIVVLAVIGLMTGMGVRGLRALAKSDLRSSTAKLSGAIRYLFDRASTTGRQHRLVIDLDEGRYWAEVSDDRFFVPRDLETAGDLARQREEEEARKQKEAQGKGGASGQGFLELGSWSPSSSYDPRKMEVADFTPKRARFGAFKDTTLKPVTMKNVKVVDVHTPRLAEPITSGRAYIYFFALGQTEAAVVHLSDPDGETQYSIVVHPITGRVRIYNEYVQPRIAEEYDDAGNRIER